MAKFEIYVIASIGKFYQVEAESIDEAEEVYRKTLPFSVYEEFIEEEVKTISIMDESD